MVSWRWVVVVVVPSGPAMAKQGPLVWKVRLIFAAAGVLLRVVALSKERENLNWVFDGRRATKEAKLRTGRRPEIER